MTENFIKPLTRHSFYQRSLRSRVVLSQLPLSVTVGFALVLILILSPSLLQNSLLVTSLSMNVILLVACIVVPWDKLPPASYLVIPYLDFLAIAFFREGAQSLISSSGLLALFPVFWICSSGFAPRVSIICSTLAGLLIVWGPVILADQLVLNALLSKLLLPFMMMSFAIAVVVFTNSMDKHRIKLEIKDELLRAALEESQQRERLLETIVDTVGVGVVAVDASGNDRFMNTTQSAIHKLGIPPEIVDPEEKELLLFSSGRVPLAAHARPVRRAINGETFTNYQIWIGTGNGARALSTTARTLRDADGTFDGAVIAFHDVTDMVNALAAKDDFVANVSHEFRTPLTAIQAYLEMALDTPNLQPPEVTQYLNIADRNADRLGGLVSDLLATASITVKLAASDISQLLADSIASAAPGAAANRLTIDCQSPETLTAMVDGGRISQVLDNLVSNAVKYSPDGGTLTIRAWADGTDLWCRVTDSGLGMSAKEQAGLFQKFYRAGTAKERGIPGIGLGLMVSKAIIDIHGGTMKVASELGVGTTVSFVIPACLVNSEMVLN